MSAPPTAAASTPEERAKAFEADPRIHFDRESNSWRYEQDDGTELEYDTAKAAWVPVLDEDLIKKQQAAYSVAGVDEETPAAPILARIKKRKQEDYTSASAPAGPSKRGKGDKEQQARSKNTAVYVTGLPLDTDVDEIVERFSKCGVIEEDDEGDPKIKLYANEDGNFTGEALVVFFKEDSVILAINLLDEAELRIGDASTVIKVRKAEFGHKNSGGSGETNGAARPRRTVDKKKITRRIGKMQKKLQEWDDDDGFGPSKTEEDNSQALNKNSRVVVLKHMFAIEDLEKDATLLLDLKEDVREEASTLGEVTNVVLYDKEPDGVMTIKFREPLSAQACVIKMNGRFFDGKRIEASLYAGKQRFKRSGAGDEMEGDTDEAEKKRLDTFAQWLMAEGD
ncbi:hypothetical protein CONPUDRAFT_52939 [Coniophora puteana RWD-64-598 SS2]|uniref:RRM domain-containing protein n=1 Tax=Coniophora puteana (strain RWD-64-598) TaxID=741705 RepID=A0A5M3MV73_CONPW|nr:uncharacterized protein CONPUDRAFT_52939 [Coniophora puteana RWD-64-598 SS2]EIW83023.1 hypothetical protein CONPUDRAFT_52939 [Coniophora puteana RWD-64-598 SS2]